jgi:hypothetical protein
LDTVFVSFVYLWRRLGIVWALTLITTFFFYVCWEYLWIGFWEKQIEDLEWIGFIGGLEGIGL